MRLALLALFFWLGFLSPLWAVESKSFITDVSQPVVGKEVAVARNRAFARGRERLVDQAVQEILGEAMYQEFKTTNLGNFQGSHFLSSVKVLEEKRIKNEYVMRVEGRVDHLALTEQLSKLGLVLPDDPWTKVAILVAEPLVVPVQELLERLKLFHLEASSPVGINLEGFPAPRDQPPFIEALFKDQLGQVIFLIEPRDPKTPGQYTSVGLRIFRRADFSQLGSYQMGIEAKNKNELDVALNGREKDFLSLFSISSLAPSTYDVGSQAELILEVVGLKNAQARERFEQYLKATGVLKSLRLIGIAVNKHRFLVEVKAKPAALVEELSKPNASFSLSAGVLEGNRLPLLVSYLPTHRITNLIEVKPDPDLVKQIAAALDLEKNQSPPPDALPIAQENEPNNTTLQYNQIGSGGWVLGQLSSRGDDDLFQLTPPANSKRLIVEWTRLNKSDLSPQFKLYGPDFEFLGQAPLTNQKKGSTSFELKDDAPKTLLLRLSDRVGFIQGESGGFKNLKYLIKVWWK